jgi:hypothetical protein
LKWFVIAIQKVLEYFKYAFYARFLLELHQLLLLSSAVEIQFFDFSEFSRILSFCLSGLGLLFGICITFVALMVFFNEWRNHDPDKKFVLMEMILDIKDTRMARLYIFMLLARRTMFVLIIIFLVGEIHRTIIYSFLALIQLIYFVFIVSIY